MSIQSGAERDPVVICQYGPPKLGKTTSTGFSFPTAAYLAAPGALNSIESVCGYQPKRSYVSTIEEATPIIEAIGKSGKYETVVIDDFSFMAEQSFSALEQKHSGFKLWGKLRDAALAFRDTARYSGVNVVLTCWEQGPKIQGGTQLRGGPKLSGRLPEQIPALCDMVLRVVPEPKQQPWPVVYRCKPDPSYIMGDRLDVASIIDPAPMNLAELLRAAGREVARHPDMPKQEERVAALADAFSEAESVEALANEVYAALIEKGVSVYEARWTVRDALDRALIRRELAAQRSTFFTVSQNLL